MVNRMERDPCPGRSKEKGEKQEIGGPRATAEGFLACVVGAPHAGEGV